MTRSVFDIITELLARFKNSICSPCQRREVTWQQAQLDNEHNLIVTIRHIDERVCDLERQQSPIGGVSNCKNKATAADDTDSPTTKYQNNVVETCSKFQEIDVRFQLIETANYGGVLMWKIRDYTARKAKAVAGTVVSLYSQPFYTSQFGYRMCARAYLNGDGLGKGSHLSLFFVVMRGHYDALLKWPFTQRVTMTVLDQETGKHHVTDSFYPDPENTSFRRPVTDMNVATGCPLFVCNTVLEVGPYVRDDTLFIKMVVDTNGLNDP